MRHGRKHGDEPDLTLPTTGERKTLQARILAYARKIGWTFVPREEAEQRRGFDPAAFTPEARARPATLYFGDLLHAKVREFHPKYQEADGALVGRLQRLPAIGAEQLKTDRTRAGGRAGLNAPGYRRNSIRRVIVAGRAEAGCSKSAVSQKKCEASRPSTRRYRK